jgi:TM2 domain-containing membrane protein YozV
VYLIIGGDGRQYGPVDGETVRRWIADHRANAQTLVQAVGTNQWSPLAGFAEFHQALGLGQPLEPPRLAPAPVTAVPGQKSRLAAGLLGIFLGYLGVHRFYLGYTGIGIAQIIVTIFTCGFVGWIWGLIDGLMILTGSISTDAQGRPLGD